MIQIKNKVSIKKMEEAGSRLAGMFHELKEVVVEGKTTLSINDWIEKKLKLLGLSSEMKGYMGYRYVSCISVNDIVVHGVPSSKVFLKIGDMLTIDVCASYKGYCADMARNFFVGGDKSISAERKKLSAVAQLSLDAAIEQAFVGNRLTDISAAVQRVVESHGFGVVRDYAGHGIGKNMHEDPEILNYGKPGRGPLLQVGMTFALEPMITQGSYKTYVDGDGWTVKTVDKSDAAHVEDTVVITEQGPKILTRSFGA